MKDLVFRVVVFIVIALMAMIFGTDK